ncbi:Trk system potassium transporter TrkA [Spirochaetota bacterium]
MKVIIVGAGMIGIHIARELIEEARDVVMIEKDADAARRASEELDCMVINEDGSKPETLRKAGAGTAGWFLALTGSDEVNIVACGLVSAEARKVKTLARIENPFYSALSKIQMQAFGIDVIVSPAAEAANAISHIVNEGFAEDVIPLHDGELQLRLVQAETIKEYAGKALRDAQPELNARLIKEKPHKKTSQQALLAAAVLRNGNLIVPSGDTVIEKRDSVYLLGTPDTLDLVLGPIYGINASAKRILVVGATKTVERFTAQFSESVKSGFWGKLLGRKCHIGVIEANTDSAKRLARAHQEIEVIQGDSSEEGVLEGSGVAKSDLVVCATENQTHNILTAQLAKTLGAKKSLAIVTNDRYLPLAGSLDIDALISIKAVVAASVLKIVRRGNIRTIYRFFEDDVELVELRIKHGSELAGRPLKDISLPKDVLVAFVMRGKDIIVPNGLSVLEKDDVVGIVSRKKSIAGLESIFGGSDGN